MTEELYVFAVIQHKGHQVVRVMQLPHERAEEKRGLLEAIKRELEALHQEFQDRSGQEYRSAYHQIVGRLLWKYNNIRGPLTSYVVPGGNYKPGDVLPGVPPGAVSPDQFYQIYGLTIV